MDIRTTIYVDPADTPDIHISSGLNGPSTVVSLRSGGPVPSAVDIAHGAKSRPGDEHGMTPPAFADWLRSVADQVDVAWWQWLDDNSSTYMLDEPTYTYRCCSGYLEHFDGCTIRNQIAAARRALAKRDADERVAVDEPAGHLSCERCGSETGSLVERAMPGTDIEATRKVCLSCASEVAWCQPKQAVQS